MPSIEVVIETIKQQINYTYVSNGLDTVLTFI
jgi:hypothetical protein